MHQAFEAQFARTLLAPTAPTASKRFAVYRNNVFVSLVEALKARFPAVQNAVGPEFFEAMARDYAVANQPASPLMMQYGDSFPDFIEGFPPLADFPWLADLARLEGAITQSYHAADAAALGSHAFARIAPEDLSRLRMTLHPAMRLIVSRFPVTTLWRMNRGEAPLTTIEAWSAETALIYRPDFTVAVDALSPASGTFLTALHAGETLADAVEQATLIDDAFDLTTQWQCLIGNGLVTTLTLDD